ncbi:MAG: hypothetical protein ACLGHY_01510 [Gammaproteobacteria bacterium]
MYGNLTVRFADVAREHRCMSLARIALALTLTAAALAPSPAHAIEITLDNRLSQNAYFMFAGGGALDGTIGGVAIEEGKPYGGFTGTFGQPVELANWESGRLLISVAKPLTPPFRPSRPMRPAPTSRPAGTRSR